MEGWLVRLRSLRSGLELYAKANYRCAKHSLTLGRGPYNFMLIFLRLDCTSSKKALLIVLIYTE